MGVRTWSYGSATEWLRGPDQMVWRRTFSGRPDQVGAARDFARFLVAGCGREGDITYIVSELATNAIRHTRSAEERVQGGWFGVELVYPPGMAGLAYIAVTDQGGGGVPTVLPEPPRDAEGGRGLRGVVNLAASFGIHGSPRLGHTVWADIDMHATATLTPELAILAS